MTSNPQLDRIGKNINSLEKHLHSWQQSTCMQDGQQQHLDIIQDNLEMQRSMVKLARNLLDNKKQVQKDIQDLIAGKEGNLFLWLDCSHWLCHLSLFGEVMTHWTEANPPLRTSTNPDRLVSIEDILRKIVNRQLGTMIIFTRFADDHLVPQCYTLFDDQLRERAVELTSSLFLKTFSSIEKELATFAQELVKAERLKQPKTFLQEVWWQNEEKINLAEGPVLEAIEKVKKEVDNQKLPFARIIKALTNESFLEDEEDERKVAINDWLFFLDERNSLMHNFGYGLNDRKITLWRRNFELKKNKFVDHYSDFFVNLTIRLMELFVDLRWHEVDTQSWKQTKQFFVDISPFASD